MAPHLYSTIYFLVMTALCLIMAGRFISSPGNLAYQRGSKGYALPILIAIVLIFWLGNRPIFGGMFGDTANYGLEYMNMVDPSYRDINWRSEWLWQWIMVSCKKLDLSVSDFFTVIEAGYITPALIATFILVPRNPLLGWLMVLDSLMFFTFGTNGLRNGLACNTMLLAFALFFSDQRLLAVLTCLIAFSIHRSTMLPIAAVLCALTFFKRPQYAIYVWVASIFVSLVAGSAVTNFIANLGFDDRLVQYTDNRYDLLSSSRFRWDFLFYSAIPVAFGWYICIRRRISENWYNALFVTYCLCNAFWIIVIRSNFSNRFAYLSWFIYPFLIAYPLIMIPTWRFNQDRNTAYVIFFYAFFTLAMQYLWGYIRF